MRWNVDGAAAPGHASADRSSAPASVRGRRRGAFSPASWLPVLALAALVLMSPARAAAPQLVPAELVERSGRTLDFPREVIGRRVVVISFTWGGCTTVCPLSDRIMAQLQQRLGPRLGEVRLLTITLDPVADAPALLAERARGLGAGPHWWWFGGGWREVQQVLGGLGAVAGGDLSAHPPLFVVGDGASGRFSRELGLMSAEQLAGRVEALLDARGRPR